MNDGGGNTEMTQAETDLNQQIEKLTQERDKWKRFAIHRIPTHGPCCTCQKCGLDHDSCRCDLDDICTEMENLELTLRELCLAHNSMLIEHLDLKAKLTETEQELSDCRETLVDERDCHGQTIAQLKRIASEQLAAMTQERNDLDDTRQGLEAELVHAKAMIANREHECEVLSGQRNLAQAERDQLQARVAEQEEDVATLTNAVKNLQQLWID